MGILLKLKDIHPTASNGIPAREWLHIAAKCCMQAVIGRLKNPEEFLQVREQGLQAKQGG